MNGAGNTVPGTVLESPTLKMKSAATGSNEQARCLVGTGDGIDGFEAFHKYRSFPSVTGKLLDDWMISIRSSHNETEARGRAADADE